MKKIVKVTLIAGLALMLLFLGGCKSNQDNGIKTPIKNNETTKSESSNEETKTESAR